MPAGIVNEGCGERNPCAVGTLPGRCDPPGNYGEASELSRSMTYTARPKKSTCLTQRGQTWYTECTSFGGAGRLENIGWPCQVMAMLGGIGMNIRLVLVCIGLCIPGAVLSPCFGETDLDELAKAPAGTKHAYGDDPLQFGELTLPAGSGPHPVVVFIHGGCWLGQYDLPHSRALAVALAKDGFAVWNLEYRRVGNPGGGWPGTFLDIARGADHLTTLAGKHKLDLSRVIACGHSAGGQLALWLAGRHKIPTASELYSPKPLDIFGVLALAPASQLDQLHEKKVCGHVVDKLIGGSPEAFPARYDHTTPSRLAPLGARQIILVGTRDTDWGWNGEVYMKTARAAGEKHLEFLEAPDAGHFEVIDPTSTTWPLVQGAMRKLVQQD